MVNGGRVPKNDPRIEANGLIDEFNSWIGFVRSINSDRAIDELLGCLQSRLNILCSDIAAPLDLGGSEGRVPRVQVSWDRDLEAQMELMEKDLNMLSCPVLPGASPCTAAIQLARSVCRRAELKLQLLIAKENSINPAAVRFVNRLSEFLYILSQWSDLRYLAGTISSEGRFTRWLSEER